jgi:hypothetical protein
MQYHRHQSSFATQRRFKNKFSKTGGGGGWEGKGGSEVLLRDIRRQGVQGQREGVLAKAFRL